MRFAPSPFQNCFLSLLTQLTTGQVEYKTVGNTEEISLFVENKANNAIHGH